MKGVIIIPARLQSTRLPGKLLLDRTGKPLIRHVIDNCVKAVEMADNMLDGPYIASGDKELFDHAPQYSFIYTTGDHENGTSRCVEAVRWLKKKYDFVINVQADEPELSPEAILRLAATPTQGIGTIVVEETSVGFFGDQSVVKAAMGINGRVHWFSRSPIPYGSPNLWHRHVGVYRYQADFLRRWCGMPATYENLEQLDPMIYGIDVHAIQVQPEEAGHAINTRQDYDSFVTRYIKEHPECHSHA